MNNLYRLRPRHVLAFLIPAIAACGSSDVTSNEDGGTSARDSGAGGHRDSEAGACETIPATRTTKPLHIDATGSKAADIWSALVAILDTATPPVPAASTYSLSSIACANVAPPNGASGYTCGLTLSSSHAPDGGPLEVDVDAPSMLAENLMNALTSAGVSVCGAMGTSPDDLASVAAADVVASEASVAFDDVSVESFPPTPNAVIAGTSAAAIVSAIASAGLDDCDPTRNLSLACTKNGAESVCGAIWEPRDEKTGLVPFCPGAASAGPAISTAQSEVLWSALLAGASSIGWKPMDGTLSQATVINASYFARQSSSLALTLTIDNASPP